MLQLSLFPSREMTRPRLPKAVVVQARFLRGIASLRRQAAYWKWAQRISAFETLTAVPPRTAMKVGRTSARRKPRPLTDDEVRDIRTSKLSPAQLAEKYTRHVTSIYEIRKRTSYANVT